MKDSRNILAYFAVKYLGDWHKIYKAICEREEIDDAEFDKIISSIHCNYTTLLDFDYPQQLRNISQPPFVLFYYGDISLLNNFAKFFGVFSANTSPYVIL